MATADFDLSIHIEACKEDALNLIEVLRKYNNGEKGVYFSFMEVEENDIEDDLDELLEEEDVELEVTALGPYGSYMFLNDVDLFRDMAVAAPDAYFEAEINGGTTYTEQSLNATLEEGILHIETYFLSNDDVPDAYEDYFVSIVPYHAFIAYFGIDENELDEDDYRTFVNDVFCFFDEDSFEQMDYDDFVGNLDIETEIDEDTFKKFISELDILNYYDFQDEYEGGDEEEFDWNPLTQEYIKD